MHKKIIMLGILLPSLALSILGLPILGTEAVQLRDGKNYFINLPTLLEVESTVNYVYARNATYYFAIALPQSMGANLGKLEIVQSEGFDAIDFRLDETIAYLQPDSGDRIAISGKAEIVETQDQPQQKIVVTFDPPISAVAALNRKLIIGLRPVRNPRYDGVYLFGVSASPDGDRPNTQFLGYGRLNFYDPRR